MQKHRITIVAARLGRGISTLRRWEKEERMRFHRTAGGHRYLEDDELAHLLRITAIPKGARLKRRPLPPVRWWEDFEKRHGKKR